MAASESKILDELIRHGFRPVYQSMAVTLFVHPELPGVEARVGTTHVVVEFAGRDVYQSSHASFDIQRALAVLAEERNRGS